MSGTTPKLNTRFPEFLQAVFPVLGLSTDVEESKVRAELVPVSDLDKDQALNSVRLRLRGQQLACIKEHFANAIIRHEQDGPELLAFIAKNRLLSSPFHHYHGIPADQEGRADSLIRAEVAQLQYSFNLFFSTVTRGKDGTFDIEEPSPYYLRNYVARLPDKVQLLNLHALYPHLGWRQHDYALIEDLKALGWKVQDGEAVYRKWVHQVLAMLDQEALDLTFDYFEHFAPHYYNQAVKFKDVLKSMKETTPSLALLWLWARLDKVGKTVAVHTRKRAWDEMVEASTDAAALTQDLRKLIGKTVLTKAFWRWLARMPIERMRHIVNTFERHGVYGNVFRTLEALSRVDDGNKAYLTAEFVEMVLTCTQAGVVLRRREAHKREGGFAAIRAAWRYASKAKELNYYQLRNDLAGVLRWIDTAAPELDNNQRTANWSWFLEQFHNYQLEIEFGRRQNNTWESLLDTTEVKVGKQKFTFVPLTSSRDLFQEGRVMHHCVASYDTRCLNERRPSRIFSVRDEQGARVATVEIVRDRDQWQASQMRGHCNACVSNAVSKASQEIAKLYTKADKEARAAAFSAAKKAAKKATPARAEAPQAAAA